MPRTSASHVPVAILGAGLTGMSAALRLRELGVGCRLFERLSRPGGHAVTVEEQGYRFDRTGHLLHVADPVIRDLALGWIGPEHRLVERDSVVWSHGVYTPYPFQANVHGLPPEVAYDCVMGFLQASGDAGGAESFEDFCLAVFGEGISRHFMIPYNTRLWGVPPSEITADWCARFVPRPTVEDVIAGAVGHRRRELGYNARFIYPERGIGQLAGGMAAALGDIELGRSARRVGVDRTLSFDDEEVSCDVLINTAPLPALVRLLDEVPPPVLAAADKLRCTHLWYLDVALSVPAGRPYHWVYVPEERYPFYRVGCYSAFSPAMAPAGAACLYVELSDRAEPDLDTLLPQVAAGLCEMGFITGPDDIAFARPRRIDHAYVIFDHHYYGALDTIRPLLEERRIVSAGRYGGWNYSSMADALRFGREAAEQAAGWLR